MRDPANAEWVDAETRDVLSILPDIDRRIVAPDYFWNEKLDIILAKRGYLRNYDSMYHPHPRFERTVVLAKWICDELARHGRDIVIECIHVELDSYYFMPRDAVINPAKIVYDPAHAPPHDSS